MNDDTQKDERYGWPRPNLSNMTKEVLDFDTVDDLLEENKKLKELLAEVFWKAEIPAELNARIKATVDVYANDASRFQQDT